MALAPSGRPQWCQRSYMGWKRCLASAFQTQMEGEPGGEGGMMAKDHDDSTNANNEVDAVGGGAAKVEEVPSSPHPMETGAPEQQQGNGGGVGEATTTTTAAAAAAAAEGGGELVQHTPDETIFKPPQCTYVSAPRLLLYPSLPLTLCYMLCKLQGGRLGRRRQQVDYWWFW